MQVLYAFIDDCVVVNSKSRLENINKKKRNIALYIAG